MRRGLIAMCCAALLLPAGPPASAAPPACDTPDVPITTAYLPNVTKTLGGPLGWVTPFIVQNTGDTETTLELSFFRFSDGALVVCRKITGLKPGTSYADIPNNDADLPDDTQFAVVVKSFFASVVTVVNQQRGEGDTFQSSSYVGFTSGAKRVYLPIVARGHTGYDVPFIVQNIGDALMSVTANFLSFDGKLQLNKSVLVMPGRSTVFDPDAMDGLVDGTQYSVTVNSDQPIAVVANGHDEAIGLSAYSYDGIGRGFPGIYAPYAAKSGPAATDRDTPVVVMNVGVLDTDVRLTFTPLGPNGGDVQEFTFAALPPLRSLLFDPRLAVDTAMPCATKSERCLGPGEYALAISSGGPVAAVVLPTTARSAAAYAARGDAGTRAYLPNVTRTLGGRDGWTTPLILQSITATNAVLRWYRFRDGSLAVSQTMRLPAGGGVWVDPRTVAGLEDDTQYAVVVDGELGASGGKINAIVYELGPPNGDSAMIYEAFPGTH